MSHSGQQQVQTPAESRMVSGGRSLHKKGSTQHPWIALILLMLPVLLISVDNTVLAFAVPQLSAQLAPTSAQLLWIVDIYPLILATLLVPMGAAADRYGRKKLLMIGGAGFTIVSALAAFSPNAVILIMARAGMAIFGATLMPSTLSLIRNIFTDAKKRRHAIAIWAAGFSAGAALGPIIGGVLLEHFSWGSIFLMAVPIMLPFLLLAPIFIPESSDPSPGKFDLPSVAIMMLTMGSIVYGITDLATGKNPLIGAIIILFGLGMALVFVRRQLRIDTPLLDVTLFRNPVFRGSVIINLLSVFSLVGFIFFITQDLQLVIGLEPMAAAFVLVPGLIATVIAGLLVVPIVSKIHPSIVVAINFTLAGLGYALIAFTDTTAGIVAIAFIILGIGIGAGETISNDLILSTAPPKHAGSASAISETAYEVGAALGTVVIGGIITAHFRTNLVIPSGISRKEDIDTLGAAVQLADKIGGSKGAELLANSQEAFASSAVLTAGIGAILMIAAAVYAAISLRKAEV